MIHLFVWKNKYIIKNLQNFNSSIMQKLLEDPSAIHFVKNSRISLALLKNEIDRRVMKIQLMVNQSYPDGANQSSSKQRFDKFIQTNHGRFSQRSFQQPKQKVSINILHEKQKTIYGCRQTRSFAKRPSQLSDLVRKIQTQSRVLEEQQNNDQFLNFRRSQIKSIYKDSSKSQVEQLALQFSQVQFNEETSYQEQLNNIKEEIRKRLSRSNTLTKKSILIQTQRPLRQKKVNVLGQRSNKKEVHIKLEIQPVQKCSKRIIVSSQMLTKLSKEIEKRSGQKRTEYNDPNIRSKIIKKIQQKVI